MKKSLILPAVLLFAVFFSSLVLAEISISQPKALYSIGDEVSINVTLNPSQDNNDFLSVKLICDQTEGYIEQSNETNVSVPVTANVKEIEIYKSAISVKQNIKKIIPLEAKLDATLIENLAGRCMFQALYTTEEANSQAFELSDDIEINFDIQGSAFSPNDQINITGTATKKNGLPANGFVEARIEQIGVNVLEKVEEGAFSLVLTIPENAESGSHTLKLEVYEKDIQGKVTNTGITETIFRINSILKSIDVALSETSVIPGNTLTYTAVTKDQADADMGGEVSLRIFDPNKNIAREEVILAGEPQEFTLETNSTQGYWSIKVKSGEAEKNKIFYVEELQKATFELKGNILLITNIGNVIYTKPIEVAIGGVNQVKEVQINVGEYEELKLNAPDGEYEVGITEGNETSTIGTTFLTGNAISIGEIGGFISTNKITITIWFLVLLVLAAIAIFFYRKIKKNTFYGKMPSSNSFFSSIPERKFSLPQALQQSQASSFSSSSHGEKQEAEVISLKIKNESEIKSSPEKDSALNAIESALNAAKSQKARIYSSGEYRILILSRATTGNKDDTLLATAIAQDIKKALIEHNSQSALKIRFGIGVNLGEMIVERSNDGQLKFTSMGNIVGIAKRLSEVSNADTLISEKLRRRVAGKVKTDRLSDKNMWRVSALSSREKYDKFVSKFSEKQKKRIQERESLR